MGYFNIEHLYQCCVVMLSYHLQTSQGPLVKACYQLVSHFPPRKSLISRADGIIADFTMGDISERTPGQLRQALQLMSRLCAKPLLGPAQRVLIPHGAFNGWEVLSTVNRRALSWLCRTKSCASGYTQAKVMWCPVPSVMCRFCHAREETIQHLLVAVKH